MSAFVGPLTMICGVLAVAGIAKTIAPRPTHQALTLLGLRTPMLGVRLLGVAEVALAIATVVFGGTILVALVGALHLGFAGVVLLLLRRPGAASCGCFGSLDTPASGTHLGANLISAAVAFCAFDAPGLASVLGDQPGGGVAYVVLVAAGTGSALAVLTLLPRLGPGIQAAPAFALRAKP
jgi:hypothetical protein